MESHEAGGREHDEELYELEVLDAEIVVRDDVPIAPSHTERLPAWASTAAVQTAVAAATGFVAGAATLALLRRHGRSRFEHAATAPRAEPPLQAFQMPGASVRTYVVQVRTLRPNAE